jgi:hypothetical protein
MTTRYTITLFLVISFSFLQSKAQHLDSVWSIATNKVSYVTDYEQVFDSENNLYLGASYTGTYCDMDPRRSWSQQFLNQGKYDILLGKYDSTGKLLWHHDISTYRNEYLSDITVDDSNNLYVAGTIENNVKFGSSTSSYMAFNGTFLAKYDTGGNFVSVDTFRFGIEEVRIDTLGNYYLAGSYDHRSNFDWKSTGGKYFPGRGSYAAKYSKNWDLLWVKTISGLSLLGVRPIYDSAYNVIMSGQFLDSIVSPHTKDTLTSKGGYDIGTVSYDSAGNQSQFYSFGSSRNDFIQAHLNVNENTKVFAFQTLDSVDINPGAGSLVLPADSTKYRYYLVQIDDSFKHIKYIEFKSVDKGSIATASICKGDNDELRLTGRFSGLVNFTGNDINTYTLNGGKNNVMFLARYSDSLKLIQCRNTKPYHSNSAQPTAVQYDQKRNAFTFGYWTMPDFGFGDTIQKPEEFAGRLFFARYKPCTQKRDTIRFTACDTFFTYQGQKITEPGRYNDGLIAADGCDSLLTIDLDISHSSDTTLYINECNRYTFPSGNKTVGHSGTYTDIIANKAGCDSIITIHLTLRNSRDTIYPASCDSFTSPSGDYVYFYSGRYNDTLVNANSCDSIIHIIYTNQKSRVTRRIGTCDSFILPFSKRIARTTGSYSDTTTNDIGCDSIMTFEVNILKTLDTAYVSRCDSFVAPSTKGVLYKSGNLMDTFVNRNNCDSLVLNIVTITYTTHDTLKIDACKRFISPNRKINTTKSGLFLDTLTSSAGCDSFLTYDITINANPYTFIDTTSCDSFLSKKKKVWYTTGYYNEIISDTLGCDSTFRYSVTINKSSSSFTSYRLCTPLTSPSGNFVWTKSGTYLDTISNTAGCDSLMEISLVIDTATFGSKKAVGCDSYYSISGNQVWTKSGVYKDSTTNKKGCDSIITVDLIINHSTQGLLTVTACDNYSSQDGKHVWDTTGVYFDRIRNSVGCDSTIETHLTINRTSRHQIKEQSCVPINAPSGSALWDTTGIYIDTLTNATGCDSILTVDLTIIKVDTSYSKVKNKLVANTTSGNVQWLTCDSILQPLPNATYKTYFAKSLGRYALEVEEDGCKDTTDCFEVDELSSILSPKNSRIVIYPNPTTGTFWLDVDTDIKDIRITDVQGKTIPCDISFTNGRIRVAISVNPGMYFITYNTGNELHTGKLLISY